MKQTPIFHRHYALRAVPIPNVKLNNIALIPASELHSLDKWQKLAQQLSPGDTLFVVPWNNPRLQEVGRRMHQSLGEQGRAITIVPIHAS